MAQSFIRVGGSRALTIPSKAIKELGYDDDTLFEFNFVPNGFSFTAKKKFQTKEKRRAISSRMRAILENPVVYSEEEIENDERLKAIIEG